MKKPFWKTKKFWISILGVVAATGVGTAYQETAFKIIAAVFG